MENVTVETDEISELKSPLRILVRSFKRSRDKWKTKYGGMQASDIKRLRELEEENRQLKQISAELLLENRALKDVIAKKL